LAFISVLSLSSCSSTPAPKPGVKKANNQFTGFQRRMYTSSFDHKIAYAQFYIPDNYQPDHDWPVVIILHGSGSDGGRELGSKLLRNAALSHGYLVVAPSGLSDQTTFGNHFELAFQEPSTEPVGGPQNGGGPNTPRSSSQKDDKEGLGEGGPNGPRGMHGSRSDSNNQNVPDPSAHTFADPEIASQAAEADVIDALRLLSESYKIDEQHIYLLGNGTGAAGVWSLAAKHPNYWAAVAASGGVPTGKGYPAVSLGQLPVLILQGGKDEIALPQASELFNQLLVISRIRSRLAALPNADHTTGWMSDPELVFRFFDETRVPVAEQKPVLPTTNP